MLGFDLWTLAQQNQQHGVVQFDKNGPMAKDDVNIGIIPRTVTWLLDKKAKHRSSFRMLVNYMEIYNEKLIDLLNMDDATRLPLDIRETSRGQIMVPGLTHVEVNSLQEVLEVLWCGAQSR